MNILNLFKPKPKPINVVMPGEQESLIETEITPDSIISAKALKNSGQLGEILSLYTKLIAENDNLAGTIDIRKEAAKTASYNLPELPQKEAEYFKQVLDKMLPDLIEKSIDLKLKGVLFNQIIYKLEDNLFWPDALQEYHNIDLRVIKGDLHLFVEDKKKKLPELNFIMLVKDDSILESLLKYYVFYSFALNNWAQFTETYGKPTRIGKYLPGSSKKDIAVLKNMIQSLGSDLAAVIPDSTLIEFVESKSKSGSSDLYENLANFVENRETRRILGQTMATKESASSGYAQAKVQEMVRQDILLADLRDASLFISDFLTLLNNINFNENRISIKLFSPKSIDVTARVAVDMQLDRVIDIPAKYWYDTYEIPEPDTGMKKVEPAPVITKPTNTAPVGITANQEAPPPFSPPLLPKAIIPLSPTPPQPQRPRFSASQRPRWDATFINTNEEPGIKRTSKTAAKLKKQLQNMKYDDFKMLKFPTDLQQSFGSELTNTILKSYVKERVSLNASMALMPTLPTNSDEVDFAWDVVDTEAVHAFRAEAFEVAHVSCEDMLSQLKEEAAIAIKDGKTYKQWAEIMELKGFEAANPYHLRTNFQTATSNAQLASKWKNIEAQREIFPYLRYVAVVDESTRDEHIQLNGTVAAIDDDFWNEFYPPNGWNCRCDAEPLTNEEGAKLALRPQPWIPIDETWQKNTGKDLSIWGSWLDRKLKDSGKYDFKTLGLPGWSEISKNATQQSPELLTLKSTEAYREYFEKHVAGTVWDAAKTPVNINMEFFDKQMKQRNSQARLEQLNWIKPTITKADEIWLQKDKDNSGFFVYFKAFKGSDKGGFSVVEIKQGEIRTFFEPDRESYFDKNRKGELVYKK